MTSNYLSAAFIEKVNEASDLLNTIALHKGKDDTEPVTGLLKLSAEFVGGGKLTHDAVSAVHRETRKLVKAEPIMLWFLADRLAMTLDSVAMVQFFESNPNITGGRNGEQFNFAQDYAQTAIRFADDSLKMGREEVAKLTK